MISLNHSEHRIDCQQIELAVRNFVQECDTEYKAPFNKNGLFQQTMQNIGNIIVGKPNGQYLWLDTEDNGRVNAYVMAHVSRDVDNELCYYLTQAYLHPALRNSGYVKNGMLLLRAHARNLFCKHIIVVSSRNSKAYIRLLGGKFHPYVALLKEDI